MLPSHLEVFPLPRGDLNLPSGESQINPPPGLVKINARVDCLSHQISPSQKLPQMEDSFRVPLPDSPPRSYCLRSSPEGRTSLLPAYRTLKGDPEFLPAAKATASLWSNAPPPLFSRGSIAELPLLRPPKVVFMPPLLPAPIRRSRVGRVSSLKALPNRPAVLPSLR